MTSTIRPDVELDQRTRDELQPPCEFRSVHYRDGVRLGHIHCPDSAEFVVRSVCPLCGPKLDLVCGSHATQATILPVRCSSCSTHPRLNVISTERI